MQFLRSYKTLIVGVDSCIYLPFQEAVKQRDQSIRKYEQDIDSLEFRNSQVSMGSFI